jgi:hypothetical protein
MANHQKRLVEWTLEILVTIDARSMDSINKGSSALHQLVANIFNFTDNKYI